MGNYIYPATLLCDFYKVSHRKQYPVGTEVIYSTWTPRMSRIDGVDRVVAFGYQAFVKEYLIWYFNKFFFERTMDEVISEYKRIIKYTLGVENPDASHIVALKNLNYLPIRIRAVPEGTLTPIRCPQLTIENTHKDFFWLTNSLETLMSCEIWQASTSATIADQYRRILDFYAHVSGGDPTFVQFQGHDFSMRGMSCLEAAKLSGMGHLLSFTGTDTIPAIMAMEDFYNANIEKELVGTSIPATEHSVMEAAGHGQTDEVESYRHIIEDVEPTGFVSIVSDTWDFWKILTQVLPALKPNIMARNGRVVIRPDSGDPVLIVCGDPDGETEWERKGAIELLWEVFGGTITKNGFKQLDTHIGCIYGDAITIDRCREICQRLMAKGFASTNMVYGIGSFTYQYVTRDTFGFALKTTYSVCNGEEMKLFKNPITDKSHFKKSQKGMVAVLMDDFHNEIYYQDELSAADRELAMSDDLMRDIFLDGKLMVDDTLADIRARLASQRPYVFPDLKG